MRPAGEFRIDLVGLRLSFFDRIPVVLNDLVCDRFPILATGGVHSSRTGESRLQLLNVAFSVRNWLDIAPRRQIPLVPEDVDSRRLKHLGQCLVLLNLAVQPPSIDRIVESSNQIFLIGNKPLASLINSSTPAGKVGLAAIHQDETQWQAKVDSDDLQDQLDLLEIL